MRTVAPILALMAAAFAASAMAQYYPPPHWGGGYSRASTAQESAARGMADVIRSSGAANLMNSEAAKNLEDARKKNIENRLQWTETYFQMKQVNEQARAAKRRPAPSVEQLVRRSREQLPARLTPRQLDPVTGEIQWPEPFGSAEFESYRQQIEQLFAIRAAEGVLDPEQLLQVRQLTQQMLGVLQQQARTLPSSVTIPARKFIESLAYEASQEPA